MAPRIFKMPCSPTALMVVTVVLATVAESRLVFPAGTDMGYIIPDDPELEGYDTNWQNFFDVEEGEAQVRGRGAREALKQVDESSILDMLQSNVKDSSLRLQRREDTVQNDPVENWHGRWFPHPPQPDDQKKSEEKLRKEEEDRKKEEENKKKDENLPDTLKDDAHGVVMGVPHQMCDNGRTNLTVDWDGSPVNYTCFDPKRHRISVQASLPSVLKCVDVPKHYTPQHLCMYHTITYNTTLPVIGPHRPIWPVFGEYKFVPVQRWLHSLEHGGIVMLYDPCTEPTLVNQLREILVGCFRKHIITPYTLLTRERPLALMAWGCSLEMSTVNTTEAKEFIKERALHGPEGHYARNGSFKKGLLKKAQYPLLAEGKDSNICPE